MSKSNGYVWFLASASELIARLLFRRLSNIWGADLIRSKNYFDDIKCYSKSNVRRTDIMTFRITWRNKKWTLYNLWSEMREEISLKLLIFFSNVQSYMTIEFIQVKHSASLLHWLYRVFFSFYTDLSSLLIFLHWFIESSYLFTLI